MKPSKTFYLGPEGRNDVFTLFSGTYDESTNSEAFNSGPQKKGSLSIRANVGSGNLSCSFALAARQNSDEDFIVIDSYTFSAGPAGTAWTTEIDFDGMNALEWQLQMTVSGGSGPILAEMTVS